MTAVSRRAFATLVGSFIMWPFSSSTKTIVTASGISIVDVPGERPKFERAYKKDVIAHDATFRVKITINSSIYKSGEIDQPGGRWVLFDPDAVADKIIDPVLLPLVQSVVDEVNKIDNVWRSANPDEFVDEGGTRWRRVETS